MPEADLDTEHPTPHTLLNIKMVVWKDGEGKWGACEDRCPHRSAAQRLTVQSLFCSLGCVTHTWVRQAMVAAKMKCCAYVSDH